MLPALFIFIIFLIFFLIVWSLWTQYNNAKPVHPTLYLVVFVTILILIGVFFFVIYIEVNSPGPTPLPSRQITQKYSTFRELWRHSILSGNDLVDEPFIVTTASLVIMAGLSSRESLDRVEVLDIQTGQLIAEIVPAPGNRIHSLLVREQRLYVAISWEIYAYQLPEGHLLWQTPGKPPDRSGYELMWVDGKVVNYSTVLGEDYKLKSVYDPATGELLSQTQIPAKPWPVFITDKTEYLGTCQDLWAMERTSGRQRWQTRLNGCTLPWPVVIGSDLLVATSPSTGISGLHLIDTVNGKIKWTALGNDDLVSNFAIINKTVYAIRKNGELVGLSLQNGRETESITFAQPTDISQNSYWVAASGQTLLAYYGDSNELIVFGKN